MELFRNTATELSQLLREKKCSSQEIVKSFLARTKACEPTINAFITLTEDKALAEAAKVDAKIAKGEHIENLAGIPISLKDNIATNGVATTNASKMMANFIPPYNAEVVNRLENSGVISIGKNNLDEFAMGSTTETSYFGATKNPWDTDKVPGGSSGGSGAAVAAGEVPLSLGSDTGGSVRLPASFCGIIGLKPTYGAVSRYGVTAFASSLDQVGILARSVSDTALLFNTISGYDPKDAKSYSGTIDATESFGMDIKGLKIALPKELLNLDIDDEINCSINENIKLLEKEGAKISEISLPSLEYALSAYYAISSAEASSNLARFDGVTYGFRAEGVTNVDELFDLTRSQGFGAEIKRRIMLGAYVLSKSNYDKYYRAAVVAREKLTNEFKALFKDYDIVLTPTTSRTAYKLKDEITNDNYAGDMFTTTANLAGIPAISLPCGKASNGLPIGMQLIGNYFSEPKLLGIAKYYENLVGGFNIIPDVKGGK